MCVERNVVSIDVGVRRVHGWMMTHACADGNGNGNGNGTKKGDGNGGDKGKGHCFSI